MTYTYILTCMTYTYVFTCMPYTYVLTCMTYTYEQQLSQRFIFMCDSLVKLLQLKKNIKNYAKTIIPIEN